MYASGFLVVSLGGATYFAFKSLGSLSCSLKRKKVGTEQLQFE